MQAKSSSSPQKIVVLGTGGTIAGLSTPEKGAGAYVAGQVSVEGLLAGLAMPNALQGLEIQSEQVAQIDSKDMSRAVWQALLGRCKALMDDATVQGLVITHGTDTLEETAFFLQAMLAPAKPVVLTCAMRPADAPDADGPANLRDALLVANDARARGVLAVCAGRIMGAREVQKVHATRLDAFSSGEAGDVGRVAQGLVQWLRELPPESPSFKALEASPKALPRVEIVMSHALASGELVDVVTQALKPQGLVVAATGNGTLHQELEAALRRAKAQGLAILIATRCAEGGLQARPSDEFPSTTLSPVKARIALMLQLSSK